MNLTITVNHKQLLDILLNVGLERPVFIWGAPGIGKSAIVEQFASDVGLECVSLLGSQLAPEDIIGVPQIVEEIVYNLCDNAIIYNRPGGHVRVTVGQAQGAPYICVEDDGIGIAAEPLDRVFERFYRVDKARSRAAGGTGLGLSIVRDTVRRHGGWVIARPRHPEGSIFTVGFPQFTPDESEQEEGQA